MGSYFCDSSKVLREQATVLHHKESKLVTSTPMRPNCKVDSLGCLYGPQGLKQTLYTALCLNVADPGYDPGEGSQFHGHVVRIQESTQSIGVRKEDTEAGTCNPDFFGGS